MQRFFSIGGLHENKYSGSPSESSFPPIETLIVTGDSLIPSSTINAYITYFNRFGQQSSCFADLKRTVQKFTTQEQAVFIQAIAQGGEEASEVDATKVHPCFSVLEQDKSDLTEALHQQS